MKKVMIGILILIPIIVLVVVALVSTIISLQAWIAVEDMDVYHKNTQNKAEYLEIELDEVNGIKSFFDYLDVKVLPERANRYSITWSIASDLSYTDEDYENSYNAYLEELDIFNVAFDESYAGFEKPVYENTGKYFAEISQVLQGKPYKPAELTTDAQKQALKQEIRNDVKALVLKVVNPAIMLVDNNGYEVESNTSGNFKISSYCTFTLRVEAEHVSRVVNIKVSGDTVEKVSLNNINDSDDNELIVGESVRLSPLYTPIDSIVSNTIWRSDNESVVTVDQNGVVTAVGVGKANIYVKASKHQSNVDGGDYEYVESTPYEVNVVGGASALFGNTLTTSKSVITFDEIGITSAVAVEGCVIIDNTISLNDDVMIAKVTTNAGTLTINRCDAHAIIIKNHEFYSNESGYVLAVGSIPLRLSIAWADQLCKDPLEDVIWSTSNDSVAMVSNKGEVIGVGNGLVTITATHPRAKGNVLASIIINVQHKIASLQLKTSNEALAVGIARETVFASERFVSSVAPDEKEANYTYIVVQGEPKDASQQELRAFYSAFVFEIVSGGDYAYFDSVETNKLIFKDTLEKQGKQEIVVRVSAKYPKYEGVTRDTQKDVTIKAIYGIEVNNIKELRKAALDQKEYARREDNVIKPELKFEHIYEPRDERYVMFSHYTSLYNYAVVFGSNIAYETVINPETGEVEMGTIDEEGNVIAGAVWWDRKVVFYGSVYGNNHMFSALKGQIGEKMCDMMLGNSVMSNLIMRANNLGDNAVITDGSSTKDFSGECMNIGDADYDARVLHTYNMRIEYCIFENAKKFASIYATDVVIDGCIVRNMSQTGIWAVAEILTHNSGIVEKFELENFEMEEDEEVWGVRYSDITVNNVIVSNSIGTFAAMQTNAYSKHPDSSIGHRFGETKEESMAYIDEHFRSAGVTPIFRQTGFLDTYNWQDISNANILDVGNETINNLIASFTGPMIEHNSAFEKGRIFDDKGTDDEEDDTYWFHLGFVFTGTGGGGLVNEPIVYDVFVEDPKYYSIYARDVKSENPDNFTVNTAEKLISAMEIYFYGYSADNGEILPDTRYTVDSALIAHLHGER